MHCNRILGTLVVNLWPWIKELQQDFSNDQNEMKSKYDILDVFCVFLMYFGEHFDFGIAPAFMFGLFVAMW